MCYFIHSLFENLSTLGFEFKNRFKKLFFVQTVLFFMTDVDNLGRMATPLGVKGVF